MAFFKFRKRGDEPSATATVPESVEVMRRRAKYRLIGAAVLILIGVIGIPLLFDKQQRPIPVDTPIEIPDRNKVKPLNIPAPAATEAVKSEIAAPVPVAAPVTATAVVPKAEGKVTLPPVPGGSDAPGTSVKPEPMPAADKLVDKAVEKPAVKAVDGNKVQALLEGKSLNKTTEAAGGRYVVQVGAFSDVARAREVRLKVERVGLKTYTQVAQSKDGARIRVRVGPFVDKAEAGKVAERIKRLDLPAAILTLEKQP